MTVSAEIAYEIDAPYQQPHARDVYAEQPVFDTEEQPPHVVFTPYLRALAKEIVGDDERAAQGAQNFTISSPRRRSPIVSCRRI